MTVVHQANLEKSVEIEDINSDGKLDNIRIITELDGNRVEFTDIGLDGTYDFKFVPKNQPEMFFYFKHNWVKLHITKPYEGSFEHGNIKYSVNLKTGILRRSNHTIQRTR